MDYSSLSGGLARMLNRLQTEGTATRVPEADQFLREDGNAALVGLLLDQRVLAETAFIGPLKMKQRLGHFEMSRIAEMDPEAFQRVFSSPPAVHRFTQVMADRVQSLAGVLTANYGGQAANIWGEEADLEIIERRVRALPGFGPLKTRKIRFVLYYFGHRSFAGDVGTEASRLPSGEL